MKSICFSLLFLAFTITAVAQTEPNVGDMFSIKAPSGERYHYIDFPKANILKKRRIVSGYKSVHNITVIVSEVLTKDDGTTYVFLKPKDDSKFFGYLSTVKANYTKALAAKELSALE